MIGNLIAQGVGFREEEEFLAHEISKLRGTKRLLKKKEIVTLTMGEKLRDNKKHEKVTRILRNKALSRVEEALGHNSRPCSGLRKDVKAQGLKTREKWKLKNVKKVQIW